MPGGVSRQRLGATVAKQAALDWAQAEKQFQLDQLRQVAPATAAAAAAASAGLATATSAAQGNLAVGHRRHIATASPASLHC